MSGVFLFLAAFSTSAVEMVEALTIVLAIGVTRGWRSPLIGVGAATIVLAAIIAALGPALQLLPIDVPAARSRRAPLTFGLQWLRKAILRSSGYKPLHDEEEVFRAERSEAAAAPKEGRIGMDWYGFTIAFKGVLLEGLEVAFIVITFGSTQGRLGLAATAAGAALVVVATVGALVHAPLARVPENTIKFAVGLLLTTFGTFWAAEGAGVNWPGDELALLGLLGFLERSRSCSCGFFAASDSRSRQAKHERRSLVRRVLVGLHRRRRLARRGGDRVCPCAHRRAHAQRAGRLVAAAARGRLPTRTIAASRRPPKRMMRSAGLG